jgi:hypothetical protein
MHQKICKVKLAMWLRILHTYTVSGSKRKKYFQAISISAIAMAFALLYYAISYNGHSGAKPSFGDDVVKITEDDFDFLSFEKKEFSWAKRLKKDGTASNFDLFTNPSIYKKGHKLIIKTHDVIIIDDVLPLYLSEIRNKPYRLKVEGYAKSSGDNTIVVILRDMEANKTGECAVNGKNKTLRVQVRDFSLVEREQNGTTHPEPVVKVYDEISKKEYVLSNKQRLLEDEFIVIVKDVEGNSYAMKKIGDSVKIGDATCTLRSFSKKDGTAKLMLKDGNGQEFNKTVHLMR